MITLNQDLLNALRPQTHLVATPENDLLNKTFSLECQVQPRSENEEVDLDSVEAEKHLHEVKFRYLNDDLKPFIINFKALMFLNVVENDDIKTSNTLHSILMKMGDKASIPTSFQVFTAKNRTWKDTEHPKFPVYMYQKFEDAKIGKVTFNDLIQDRNFLKNLAGTPLQKRFEDNECLKDVIIKNVIFDAES
jgi:hypothetical protein